MVKHIQTTRRQIVNELFECVWSFCRIGASSKQNNYKVFSVIISNSSDKGQKQSPLE